MASGTSSALYARLVVPTEEVVRLGVVRIKDPRKVGHHRAIALPIVKAGRCTCSAQHTPLHDASEHLLTCIYRDNPYRCFCVHCTHQSETPDRCEYKAKRGYLPNPDEPACTWRHCLSLERDTPSGPQVWRCQRCRAECPDGPRLQDSVVTEVFTATAPHDTGPAPLKPAVTKNAKRARTKT